MTFTLANGTFTVTDEQIRNIKEITAASRYEAIDKVAEILNVKTKQTAALAIVAAGKKLAIDSTTIGDITYSKGKVKQIDLYDFESNNFIWHCIKIK